MDSYTLSVSLSTGKTIPPIGAFEEQKGADIAIASIRLSIPF